MADNEGTPAGFRPASTEQLAAGIAAELKVAPRQVVATVALLDDDATVPFIARYRKEATGGLDEVAVIAIRDRAAELRELDARRSAVVQSLTEQGKLTPELLGKVAAAPTMAALEDLYLPFRPKRRTRATMARERGLEPLATQLLGQASGLDPAAAAAGFVAPDGDVADGDAALAGARDIIAEWVSEDAEARAELRTLYAGRAAVRTKVVAGKEAEGATYRDYFDWSEPLSAAPSHRVLAMLRAVEEGFITLKIAPPEEEAVARLERRFVRGQGAASAQVAEAVRDSYGRLLGPSMENEVRAEAKRRADEEAIAVFARNVRDLLLSSPLGQKAVLAVDPGLRTGCKVVCLDRQGKLLAHEVIVPLEPHRRVTESAATLKALVKQHAVEAIAVGNGTGGREALAFCRAIDFGRSIPCVSVNESGASVYSASAVAREEFPDHDLTVRGAVSIGRRLMDPLAELVKLDPKAIGVGQYQHDVDQKGLKAALDDTVASCVNAVGVEVNTASKELLGYVSGLSSKLAGKVVAYRNEKGAFRSRRALTKVPGLGPKTFEQAAGFLRIREGDDPLDASAVHPESYGVVERMAKDLGCTVEDLMQKPELREKVELKRYVTETVGLPTLTDIMAELAKPGRDPREQFENVAFADGIRELTDLKPGMVLPGVVTNVTAFGAFVDVGVHQDGLVHVSQLSDRFVERPSDVVKVNQRVTVTVVEVDLERKRIALSMKKQPGPQAPKAPAPGPSAPRPAPPRPAPAKAPPAKQAAPADDENPFVAALKGFKPSKR